MKKLPANSKRTILDCRTLSGKLLSDLKQMMDMSFDEKFLDDYEQVYPREVVYSDNGFFYYKSGTIYGLIGFYRNEKSDRYDFHTYGTSRYNEFVEFYDSKVCVHYYYDDYETVNIFDVMKVWVDKYLVDNYGFESEIKRKDGTMFESYNLKSDFSYSCRKNSYYYKKRVIRDNELRDILESSIGWRESYNTHVTPNQNHSYRIFYSEDNPNDKPMVSFEKSGRITRMKAGKGVKKLLKELKAEDDVNDNIIKKISDVITSDFSDYQLKVVRGTDITKYYSEENHDKSGINLGSLGSSCMRYPYCGADGYFNIYEEHAELLILVNGDDKIIARAILWNAENMDNGEEELVMDRIYGAERVYPLFFRWAKEKGYLRKRFQSFSSEDCFIRPQKNKTIAEDEAQEEEYLRLRIRASFDDYATLPYFDTFAWGDSDYITNECGYGWYCARDTEGNLEGRDNDDDDYDEDDDY